MIHPYYVFEDMATANEAEHDISVLGGVPVHCINGKTGQPVQGHDTTRFAVPFARATDGKPVFPQPTAEEIAHADPQAVQDWKDKYEGAYILEEYQTDWLN